MAGSTERTFSIKFVVDSSQLKQGLAEAKVAYEQFNATISKQINMSAGIQEPATRAAAQASAKGGAVPSPSSSIAAEVAAASKSLEQVAASVSKVTKASQQASQASRDTSRASSGGGGGRGAPPRDRFPEGGFLESRARGDRSGGIGTRVRSVAEYAVAAMAVRTSFEALGKAGRTIVDVQKELQDLNKVLDVSQKQLLDFRKTATEVSKQYGVSITDTLKSYKIFAQMGLPTEEIKQYGKAVVQAKNVSEFNVEELAGLFSSASKAFSGELGGKPEKLTDALLAVESKYAITEKELGEVIKRIGPQASVLGVSLHELNALTTVMKERTRAPAEEIATSLRFITKGVMDPKVQAKIKQEIPSIRFQTDTGDLRSAYEILTDIADVYPTLTRRQQLSVAQSIAQTRHVSKFLGLMQGFSESNRIVNISQNAQGTTSQRNEIIMQSIAKQAEKVGSSFEAVAVNIGDGLVGPLTTALQVTAALLDKIDAIGKVKFTLPGTRGIPGAEGKTTIGATMGQGTIMLGAGLLKSATGVGQGAAKIFSNMANLDKLLAGGTALGAGAGITSAMGGAAALSRTALLNKAYATSIAGATAEAATGATLAKSISGASRIGTLTTAATIGSGVLRKEVFGSVGAALGSAEAKMGAAAALKLGLGKIFSGALGFISGDLLGGLLAKLGSRAAGAVVGTAIGGPVGTAVGYGAGLLGQGYINTLLFEKLGDMFGSPRTRAENAGIVQARDEATRGIDFAKGIQKSIENLDTLNKSYEQAIKLTPQQQANAIETGDLTATAPELKNQIKEAGRSISKNILENYKYLEGMPGVNISTTGRISYQGEGMQSPVDIEGEMTPQRTAAIKTLSLEVERRKTATEATQKVAEEMTGFGESIDKAKNSNERVQKYMEARALYRERGGSLTTQPMERFTGDRVVDFWSNKISKIQGMTPDQIALIRNELQTGEVSKELTGNYTDSIKNALRSGATEKEVASALSKSGTKNLAQYVENLSLSQNNFSKNFSELVTTNAEVIAKQRGGGLATTPEIERVKVAQQAAVELVPMAAMKQVFDDMQKKAENTSQELRQGFDAASGNTDKIKQTLESLDAGAIIRYVDANNKVAYGEVFRDFITGQKRIQAIETTAPGAVNSRFADRYFEQSDRVGKQTVSTLETFGDMLMQTVSPTMTVFKRPVVTPTMTEEAKANVIRTGFGAGISRDLQDMEAKQLGARRLGDLSDLVAGTFTGYGSTGPKFNEQMQGFIAQFVKLQKNVQDTASKLEVTDETGNVTYDQTTLRNLESIRTKEEAGGLLVRAVDEFGKAVKEFDSAAQKFQAYQSKTAAASMINLAPSNYPLAKLGGDAIPVWLPKTRKEMSPMERAQASRPELFKSLAETQVQFSEMQNVLASTMNRQKDLFAMIDAASTGALQGINVDEAKKMFQGVGLPTETEQRAADLFNKVITDESTGTSRQEAATNLKNVVGEGFNTLIKSLVDTAGTEESKKAELTYAAQAAVQLEALQMSAEEASRSLQNIKKYGDMFGKEPIMKALGEGPLGRLGAEQPIIFAQEGKNAEPYQLDFSSMNQFEQEREMLRRISSPEARRGKTRILNENYEAIQPISEKEADRRRRVIDIREDQYKKGLEEKRTRDLASEYMKYGKDLSASIEDMIRENPNLSSPIKSGLRTQQRSIEDIFNSRNFLTSSGKINFDIFKPIEQAGKNIEKLVPGENIKGKTNFIDTVSKLMYGGAGKDTSATMIAQQGTTNQILGQIDTKIGELVGATKQKSVAEVPTAMPTQTATLASTVATAVPVQGATIPALTPTPMPRLPEAIPAIAATSTIPITNIAPTSRFEPANLEQILTNNVMPLQTPYLQRYMNNEKLQTMLSPMYKADSSTTTAGAVTGGFKVFTPTGETPILKGGQEGNALTSALTGRLGNMYGNSFQFGYTSPTAAQQVTQPANTLQSGMIPYANLGEKVSLGNTQNTLQAGMIPYANLGEKVNIGTTPNTLQSGMIPYMDVGETKGIKTPSRLFQGENLTSLAAATTTNDIASSAQNTKPTVESGGTDFQDAVKVAADYFKSAISTGADTLKSALSNLTGGGGPGAKIGSMEEILKSITEVAKKQEEDKAELEDRMKEQSNLFEEKLSGTNIEESKKEIQGYISELESKIEEKSKNIEEVPAIRDELEAIKTTLSNIEPTEVSSMQAKLEDLEGKIEGTKADLVGIVNDSLSKNQSSIENSMRSTIDLATKANSSLNELSAKVNNLEPKVQQLESQIAGTQQLAQQAMSVASSRK